MRLLAHPKAGDTAIAAGESGVAGLAALIAAARQKPLRDVLGLDAAARVLLIGSEGVTDPAIYAAIMAGHDDA
jgi:diaminopropionate ammonia-lyase